MRLKTELLRRKQVVALDPEQAVPIVEHREGVDLRYVRINAGQHADSLGGRLSVSINISWSSNETRSTLVK